MCSCVKSKSCSSDSQHGSQKCPRDVQGTGQSKKTERGAVSLEKGPGATASYWSPGVGPHLHASWQCSWIWARASSSMCHVGSRMLW